ncbi:hypothetical protein [Ruegeria arenilitoris]|uniref:hypothetical protein n=1 Tax=Ruegeria arenilitoris TaxID=1173585 RepID=UPI001C2C90C4|nr:hypothetical protein [Ruegeria arenilitoris]
MAHSDERELLRTPVLDKQFHFVFQGTSGCHHTGRLTNERGKWVSGSVYTELVNVVVSPKRKFIIEQTAYEIAQILLPNPAIASLPDPDDANPDKTPNLVVSSVEISLHDVPSDSGLCLELAAPIPTGEYSKRWFGGAKAQIKAAKNAAKKGEWQPTVTEFHFQQIENKRQSAFIRFHWQQ